MGYYNWKEISKKYSDNELKRIYREQNKEPLDKVTAVIDELINRELLDANRKDLLKRSDNNIIFEIENVSGKTKPNYKQSKFLIIAIVVVTILFIGSIISSALQYDLLTGAKNGISITDEAAENNDMRVFIIAVITFVSYIVSSILFLIWFYRAYDNLRKRIENVEYSSGWSIGAWFVPIISLFRPFNIMTELNRKTDLIIKNRKIEIKKNRKSLIGWWWGLFIIDVYASNASLKIGLNADNIDFYIYSTIGEMFISGMNIVLAIVTIKMIKNFAEKERLLFESEKHTKHSNVYSA